MFIFIIAFKKISMKKKALNNYEISTILTKWDK
jgi:hypothetical protein